MSLDEQVLNLIKENLPAGCYQKIADSTGYSLVYVTKVMNGTRTCEKIIDCARKIAVKNKEKLERRAEKIRKELS